MPCNTHSHIGGSSANSTGYESRANWHTSANHIHHLIRWWDRLVRFTIPGMMSRILIKIWQSSNRMYSCLILFRPNQRFPASFVLNLRTRPDRNFREAVSLPGSAFVDNLCPWSSLPLLSHQRCSSVSSRIWALQFPPRSLDMFARCLFWIVEGLHTALDSSTIADYPNSDKLILVIVDGMIKGAGNTLTPPEI